MWPLPPINNNYVSIIINPHAIVCSWIQKTGSVSFELKAYNHTPLHHLESAQSILFNPTYISGRIITFLKTYNLNHAFVILGISGPTIVESIIELPIASPTPQDFHFPKLRSLIWDYRYLYPLDHRFAFYLCGISREHLAQYQLLAITTRTNIIGITTERMALLKLYQHRHGAAFRYSQFARDLQHHSNNMHDLFSTDTLRRLLLIKPSLRINIEQERHFLSCSFGLFLIAKDTA